MFHRNLTGLDLHEPTNVLVENNSGSTISAGKIVALDGFGTQRPQAVLATGGMKPFGVATADILTGKLGYVTVFGFMYNFNTSAWAPNTVLYSDGAGNLTTAALGTALAIVVKQNATTGLLFVMAIGSFIDPETSAWSLNGNAGTNSAINFLGTTDLEALVFRTNNLLAAKIDESQRFGLGPDIGTVLAHFYQKSHLAYAGSGIRTETFALTTATTSPSMAYTVTLADNVVCRAEITVIGRSADGTARCMFKRTGLWYREGGNVQIQGTILSDQTVKSDNNLDIGYTMGLTDLNFTVKSSVSSDTYWTGHVVVEILGSST